MSKRAKTKPVKPAHMTEVDAAAERMAPLEALLRRAISRVQKATAERQEMAARAAATRNEAAS